MFGNALLLVILVEHIVLAAALTVAITLVVRHIRRLRRRADAAPSLEESRAPGAR